MRVLVTGGQGCIGAWVVKGLAERGIDRRSVAFMGYWRDGKSSD